MLKAEQILLACETISSPTESTRLRNDAIERLMHFPEYVQLDRILISMMKQDLFADLSKLAAKKCNVLKKYSHNTEQDPPQEALRLLGLWGIQSKGSYISPVLFLLHRIVTVLRSGKRQTNFLENMLQKITGRMDQEDPEIQKFLEEGSSITQDCIRYIEQEVLAKSYDQLRKIKSELISAALEIDDYFVHRTIYRFQVANGLMDEVCAVHKNAHLVTYLAELESKDVITKHEVETFVTYYR